MLIERKLPRHDADVIEPRLNVGAPVEHSAVAWMKTGGVEEGNRAMRLGRR